MGSTEISDLDSLVKRRTSLDWSYVIIRLYNLHSIARTWEKWEIQVHTCLLEIYISLFGFGIKAFYSTLKFEQVLVNVHCDLIELKIKRSGCESFIILVDNIVSIYFRNYFRQIVAIRKSLNLFPLSK